MTRTVLRPRACAAGSAAPESWRLGRLSWFRLRRGREIVPLITPQTENLHLSFRILSTATPEMIDRVGIYAGAGDRGVEGDADTLVRGLVRDLLTASAAQVLHET